MFCTTFYSYKGGVGRTLALANTAVLLARRGMRVLVVDFDLEAPGLTTLEVFQGGKDRSGVVDFVAEYIETGVSPNAQNFIHPSKFFDRDDGGLEIEFSIDVMPASGDDAEYPQRFATIDWQKLYDEQNGFLLMEDLRAQWQSLGYDYVLIDSRTGLTDVGGICTRQLPDAVVCVFFLNEQNLIGTQQVVESIRASTARGNPIQTLFVASRIPRLDDEHGVLRGWLARFQDTLDYSEDQLSRVEHYDSLMLLNQALFVISRPKSGLALQYVEIANKVARLNSADPDGAVDYIVNLRRRVQNLSRSPREGRDGSERYQAIDYAHLDRITGAHANNASVQSELARAYYSWRDLARAAAASDTALAAFRSLGVLDDAESELSLSRLHQLRMRIFAEIEDTDAVKESARGILASNESTDAMLLDAMLALVTTAEVGESVDIDAPFLGRFDRSRLFALAQKLAVAPPAATLAASIVEKAIQAKPEPPLTDGEKLDTQTILIAGGLFELAASMKPESEADQFEYVAIAFNQAIACWGMTGKASEEMFSDVLVSAELQNPAYTATGNFNQCLALSHAVLDEPERAQEYIAIALEISQTTLSLAREFSCWSYQTVSAADFAFECERVAEFARDRSGCPEVITRYRSAS